MIKRIYKYRRLLFIVTLIVLKYQLLKLFLSNKAFFRYVDTLGGKRNIYNEKQPNPVLIGQIRKITKYILPKNSCLIESLAQKEVLKLYGYDADIKLSIYKSGNTYRTHAWIKNPNMIGYKTLHKI